MSWWLAVFTVDEDFGEDAAALNAPLPSTEGPSSWKVTGPPQRRRQRRVIVSCFPPCTGM